MTATTGVMEGAASPLPEARALTGWLARPPPALRFGLKLATALTVSIWVGFASALPWGLTIWTTVMFVAQPNAGASIKKGLTRISGTVAAALVSIAIYGLFAQLPPLFLASLCGVLGLAVYGMSGPRFQYAWLTLGFTTVIILIKAMTGGDAIETLAFERASLTALGVFIVFLADAIFWPVRAEKELRAGLAQRARRLAEALRQQLEPLASGTSRSEPGRPPASPLLQQLELADLARDEIGVTPGRAQALSRIALLLEGLASRVRLLGRSVEPPRGAPDPAGRATLAELGDELEAGLGEAARALLEASAPRRFADGLDRKLLELEGRWADAPDRGAMVPVLRDVVTLLRGVEEALLDLAHEGRGPGTQSLPRAAAAAIRKRPRIDPLRLQLALRAGIAGGGVVVAMLAMGWTPEEDVLPMIMATILAFIVAGASPTRGAGRTLGAGVVFGILLGWLVADLASVLFFPQVQRMPLALAYPFLVALGGGYLIVRGSFLGPLGALFAVLTAVLPVFIADAALPTLEVAYDLACGELLGVAFGLIAQRMLWPRTAMQTFTSRVAGQLALCISVRKRPQRTAEETADLLSEYAKQLSLLGQLHAQAHAEPVERALNDERRMDLLTLVHECFDAVLRAPLWQSKAEVAATGEAAAALAPLLETLIHLDEELVASLEATAAALRGDGPPPDASLREARAAVEAQLDALRGRPELAAAADAAQTARFLARLASSSWLVDSQLRLEDWLAEWQRDREATSADAMPGTLPTATRA